MKVLLTIYNKRNVKLCKTIDVSNYTFKEMNETVDCYLKSNNYALKIKRINK